MRTICICGGGSLGHVIAGYLGAKQGLRVNMLTQRPEQWETKLQVSTPEGSYITGKLNLVTNNPEEALKGVTIVLLCLPGFAIRDELIKIKPYVNSEMYIGTVFSSTGFFFEALEIFDDNIPLWGFQRVPFIARIDKYGQSARLLGYKRSHNVAVERCRDVEAFRLILEDLFDTPIKLLNNFYEASLTNSNPLLHTARLYSMFGGVNEGRIYPRMILFYEEWTTEAAQLLIDMDQEFFNLLDRLPVSKGYLPRILDYYESYDAESLKNKLSSITGFKGILSPMRKGINGWEPDYESRYFTEDFPYGLRIVWQLAQENGVSTPNIDKVYRWGMDKVHNNSNGSCK